MVEYVVGRALVASCSSTNIARGLSVLLDEELEYESGLGVADVVRLYTWLSPVADLKLWVGVVDEATRLKLSII